MPITKVLFLAPAAFSETSNGPRAKFSEILSGFKSQFSGCSAFLVASAKWRPKGKFLVNRGASPALLGENPPSFQVTGDSVLADGIVKSAEGSGLWAEATEEWGLDPGHWQPLAMLAQSTAVHAIPLSLSQMSPEAHRKWGVAVRRAAQKHPQPLGLVVSGSLSSGAESKGQKFDEEVLRIFTKGPLGALDEVNRELFKAAQPEGGWGSIYFLWGVLGDKAAGNLEYYDHTAAGAASAILSFSL